MPPNEGNCGIYYGINGMCHQVANRVMAETGKTVNEGIGVQGTATVANYGYYGIRGVVPAPLSWGGGFKLARNVFLALISPIGGRRLSLA